MYKYLLPLFFLLACNTKNVAPPEPIYPIPSEKQLAWHELEYYGFVHFNMNTFSDMEWGLGDENPAKFNPSELDTRQWARIAKEAGMKGIIITAKHHDGFCLWPSAYTEHSVKNSPWKNGEGDLIRELADACKEYGLKFGIYYSPWDRNHAAYGQPEYITYMQNQLTELLTNYGDIFEVWFDGANGGTGYYGGANEDRKVDKQTYYRWPETYALVNELQPGAVLFSDGGPDVRWVGNEEGFAYETTWGNLMRDSVYAGMPEYQEKFASGQENGTHWVPAEADVSIRPGWYYHAYEDHKVKTLPQLLDIYYKSMGRNSSLLINFPVDPRGLIHENDEQQILKLGEKIKADFEENLLKNAKISSNNFRGKGFEIKQIADENQETYWAASDEIIHNEIRIQFDKPTKVNRFLVQEKIALGQRIKAFEIAAEVNGTWKTIAEGTTVGAKRILRCEDVEAEAFRFTILDAKAAPTISYMGFYHAPKLVTEPLLERTKSGEVTLSVPERSVEIYYTLDESEPRENSNRYTAPLQINEPVRLKAIAFDPESNSKSETVVFDFDIPKDKWKVIHLDEKANHAIDEAANTFWKSDKNEIQIDLGEQIRIKGFTYLPPQNRYMSGVIQNYVFQTSEDGKNWTDQASGEFQNIHNNPIEQRIQFDREAVGRYIKLKGTKTTDGELTAFGEVGILSVK